jgi:hypothetical protein
MFFITLMTLPFSAAIVILGGALYAFTWQLFWCGERIGLFAEQLILFGAGLIMIRDGMAGIKAASSDMSSKLDSTANSLVRLGAQLGVFPIGKTMELAQTMATLNQNANASMMLNSVSLAVTKLADAAKNAGDVKTFNDSIVKLLADLSANQVGVEMLSKVGAAFASIGVAMKSMTNAGAMIIDFYYGISKFADIGKIPENLAKVGAAMRKVPGLTAQAVQPPPTIDEEMDKIEAMRDRMAESIKILGPVGSQIRDAMLSIQVAIPYMSATATKLEPAIDELYDAAYYLPTTAKWLKDGGADLATATNSMSGAMSAGKEMKSQAADFIDSMKQITQGMDEVKFYDFYYKMRDFRDATSFLATAKSNLLGASNAIRDFSNALHLLANAVAGLKDYGTIRFDAKGMMQAATEAKDSVLKYQKAVEGTQKSLDASKKSKDSQPINQVQTKTDGANAATGSYDSKMYDELLTLNGLMRQLLAKNAAGAASPTAAASNQASDSNSFTMNGWT